MNLLKQYTEGQMDAAIDWLQQYVQTADEEALHQFRVSLKKIHAVMHYFRQNEHHSKKIKQLKRLQKELFSKAGFIRDAEIKMHWLERNRKPLLLKASSLPEKKENFRQYFSAQSKKNISLLKAIKEQLVVLTKEEKAATVFAYSLQLKESVQQLISQHSASDDWHELRKKIKQLLYAWHWNRKEDQLKLLKVNELNMLDQLQNAIGAWHDAENLREWFGNEQFFLNEDMQVKKQFNSAWKKVLAELEQNEKAVEQLLKKRLKSE